MGFTGETGFRDLFKTWLHFDEMLSRQNWGKFKEFLTTWPMIFNNIFSLLPPSPTLCCSQMLRGWQGEALLASLWQGTRTTLCQTVKEVSPLAAPVKARKGQTFSVNLHGTPRPGASASSSRRSKPSDWLSAYLSFESLKIWKGSEVSSPRNRRTGVEKKAQESFPNVFLPQTVRSIKYHSHQEPALSSTTFSGVSFTSLSVYRDLYFWEAVRNRQVEIGNCREVAMLGTWGSGFCKTPQHHLNLSPWLCLPLHVAPLQELLFTAFAQLLFLIM